MSQLQFWSPAGAGVRGRAGISVSEGPSQCWWVRITTLLSVTAFINTACLLPEEMDSTFLVWNTKKEQHQICWQCHGRIFHSPGSGSGVSAHPEDPLTPSGIIGILIISNWLWWGEDEILRYQFRKINNKRKSFHFWALCAQCLLLPASVQQCSSPGPTVPWEPQEPLPCLGSCCPPSALPGALTLRG